jgi:cytochrome c-type biogenesis protein CcmH/NrfG
VVFIVALAVRLVVAAQLWDLPLVRTPKLDSGEYLAWARRIASGDFAWPVVSPHAPGYPLFLAALLTIGSGSLMFVLAAQAIIGAATAVLIAATARNWFGSRAGWIAGFAYALFGPAVYIDTAILSEGLLVFLLTVALWAVTSPEGLRYRSIVAGAALGAAILVRPTAILFAIACGVALVRSVQPDRHNVRLQPDRSRYSASFTLALLIVIAPALAKNYATSGNLTLQGYGGLNVYIGNSPLHSGRPEFRLGRGWDALNSEASRSGIADAAAQDRYYVTKTLHEIATHPGGYARLLASKLLWLTQNDEVRDSHSFYFFSDESPLLRVLPRWDLLLAFTCVGLLAVTHRRIARPQERSAWLQPGDTALAWFALAGIASVVFLVVGTRYRMPLVPAMAIAAGAGLDAIATAAASRRTRDIIVAVSVAILAFLVSHVRSDPRNRNLAEEWAFTGGALITEHNLPAAMDAYRVALRLDPDSSFAWDGFALAQYDDGKMADARSSLQRALAHDPENGRARFHLGLVEEFEHRYDDAASNYRAASALSPFDAEASLRLATVLGFAGKTREARDAMREAVRLNPANGDAWLDLCLLSLDAHDADAAASELQRAESLGANPQKLAFASQALARARAAKP